MHGILIVVFLWSGVQTPPNPWKEKLPAALAAAKEKPSAATLSAGLDASWRADDWLAGVKLARLAQEKAPSDPSLRGLVARALWRGGRVLEAEKIVAEIPPDTNDRVALQMMIEVDVAKMDKRRLADLAKRLEAIEPQTAESLGYVVMARGLIEESAGLPEMMAKMLALAKPENGYSEIYVQETVAGVPEFLEKIGPAPINRVTQFGAADMPVLRAIGLPGVDVWINGKGPYRMVLDTGGSTTLSLDREVAAEIGLKSLADATIRGVAGTDSSGQALVEELKIDGITCKRAMTRIFDVRKSLMGVADGILGTGVFANGRFTLDFRNGKLIVEPSSDLAPAGATEVPLRIVRDAKLMAPITLDGEPAVGLLDSGADAVALSPSRMRALHPDHEELDVPDVGLAMGVGGGDGPKVSVHPGANLEFAGRKFANYSGIGLDVLDTTLGPILGLQSDILLGMPVMREMARLVVDQPKAKMWVEWLEKQ